MKASIAQAKVMLQGRFVRVNETARPERFKMDDASLIPDLRALGATTARHQANEIERVFLHQPAEPFVPFHRYDPSLSEATGG